MKQALEALENGKKVREFEGGTLFQPDLEDEAITALRQAIEQAKKQEPVGFVHPEDLQSVTLGHNSYAAIYVETEGHTGGIPLYTEPPQREWVGLTGEELAQFVIDTVGYPTRLASAIEAKLKENNYGD